MASTISQIKQQVNQIGQQANATASQLSQLAANIEKNVAQVNSAIGGTASGEDKTMIIAFQQASKAVNEAATSLQAAGNAAKEWSSRA
jgi:esterase/lipase